MTRAQNDTSTPLGLTPGAPAGSYPLSDIDNVNLFNGLVSIRIPLHNYAGRGDARTQSSFTWDSPMRWQIYKSSDPDGNPMYGAGIAGNRSDGTTSYGGHSGEICVYAQGVGTGAANWCSEGLYSWGGQTLTRLFWIGADGTEHEMRDVLTGGQPQTSGGCWSQGANRGKVFVSTDGSGATFIADDPIRDGVYVNMEFPSNIDWHGWLLLKDGRRIRISWISDRGIRDRNGNLVTTVPNEPVKDSLNRSVTSGYGTSPECPGGCSYSTHKGFYDASRKIQFLNDANYRLERIFLPNGLSYRLYYSVYDDIIRIDLPTGGSIEYDYSEGLTGTQPDASFVPNAPAGVYGGGPSDYHIYRRVIERRVYREGHVLESRQTFSKPEDVYQNNLGYVDQKQYAANGALLSTERHHFYGSAEHSFWIQPTQYSAWKDGREYKTEFYDANGNLLRKVEHTWEQRAAVSWWTGSADDAPANDPRVSQTVSYLETGASSTTTYSYDPTVSYNSLTDVYVHDYNGALLRRTQTTYLKNLNSIDYTGSNIQSASALHLRDFPLQVSVYDAAGVERARTTYEYDNYNTDSNHAGLVNRTGISGFDSTFSTSYTTRANVTGTTRYLLTNGGVTGSISAYVQYDIAGNVVKTIDPRGCATTLDYTDRFGTPNGEARGNNAPGELAGQSSFAFPTFVSNCMGHTSYTQFDFHLGRPVDIETANEVVSSGYYDDSLDRPTKIIRGVGTGAQTQLLFAYDDAGRIITTSSDLNNFTDGLIVNDARYDGLGRTTETRQYEGGGKYIAVQTQYDALGRAYKVSNPFRPLAPDNETPVWTTTGFDALSRVTSITTPDNAVANTYYSGSQVLVKDQVGKERMSETNALGQLKTVWEITASDPSTEGISFPGRSEVSAGYKTSYAYDVLDNLISVSQGSQTRTFGYDSLKRLTSASNPESGTVSYEYDSNGNLLVKTDARSVSMHQSYDSLNRTIRRWYNGSSSTTATTHNSPAVPSGVAATEEVAYGYDATGVTNAKGQLTSVSSSVLNYTYTAYDAIGRALSTTQTIGTQNYNVSQTYDRAGHVDTITYPSSTYASPRNVDYDYDVAGRVSSFKGTLGDGVLRNYAAAIKYASNGAWNREQFGTSTPLYNKRFYNNRQQLHGMFLSTVNDDSNWNRGAIVNYYSLTNYGYGLTGSDTNGNLYVQQHWVPADDAVSSSTFMQQNYDYDALNRLKWVGEYANGASASGSQNFGYDRWGNRTITSASGTGINNKSFTADTSNNRLTVPEGQSGTMSYDAVGNLTNDTYSGQGQRTYDANNRMKQAWANSQWQTYSYDGNGRRVKRLVNGTETWQVYGLNGELLADYAANAVATSPQREYGYRNGEMLVTAETSAQIRWLVTDQLGTPRMSVELSGSLSSVKRNDYLPFGEELYSGAGNRNATGGYSGNTVRQKFTGYEADAETGLNFAEARYQSSVQGRFTGVDPLSGTMSDPQTWNMYAYVGNNPMNRTDPTGMSYFMGRGANDPFIRENAYRVDGFDMGPDGTASSLTDESMLTFSSLHLNLNSGSGQNSNEANTNPDALVPEGRPSTTCGILVMFTGPSDFDNTNGPSMDRSFYGLGFTVHGWVNSGGIGVINQERISSGTWAIQQMVSVFAKTVFANNKSVTENDKRASFDPIGSQNRSISGNYFRWVDHPGPPMLISSHYSRWNFTVKTINGNDQCVVNFRVQMVFNGKWDISWDRGHYK